MSEKYIATLELTTHRFSFTTKDKKKYSLKIQDTSGLHFAETLTPEVSKIILTHSFIKFN